MPRKDLTSERTGQILDAFEKCILRFGLESSSLEKVADEAGMKRPIIRHYVGNRSELVIALTDRLVENYRKETHEMIASLGESNRVDALLKTLFSRAGRSSSESVLLYENLILTAGRDEVIRERLSEWTREFVKVVRDELLREYPGSAGHRDVAWGVVSIYYNHVSLIPLKLSSRSTGSSLGAARRLVSTLGEEAGESEGCREF